MATLDRFEPESEWVIRQLRDQIIDGVCPPTSYAPAQITPTRPPTSTPRAHVDQFNGLYSSRNIGVRTMIDPFGVNLMVARNLRPARDATAKDLGSMGRLPSGEVALQATA